MARKKIPSHIVELPLATTPADERELTIRVRAAQQVQNAVLGEMLRRLDLMRESREWRRLGKLPKSSGKDAEGKAIPNPERIDGYAALRAAFDFSKAAADRFGIQCKNACWIGGHLTSNETQKAAGRAWQAVDEHSFGKKGRPGFLRFEDAVSVEGKTNATGIRWRADKGVVEWGGRKAKRLEIKAVMDPRDEWLARALRGRTKYCRLVRREIRGRWLWFVQLVQDGLAPRKYPAVAGKVGIDIGPSTIAAVSDKDAVLEPFCPTVVQPWEEIAKIQRKMDRSRRATNPDNYNPDGTAKKGKKVWNRSKRYQDLSQKSRERERRLAAERKRSHGELQNRVLAQGNEVNAEKASYLGWQKCFGRSAKVRGAGGFMEGLRRKAAEAGGGLFEFPTRKTRLSQYDHTTDDYVKKPLSLRVHTLRDGSGEVQRDLYSAFLARFVGAGEDLDAKEAGKAFPGAKPLLGRAASGFGQAAIGSGFPHPNARTGNRRPDVGAARPSKDRRKAVEAVDDVAPAEAGRLSAGGEGHGKIAPPPESIRAGPIQKPPKFIGSTHPRCG